MFKKDTRGFTVLEMMIVVILIGIIGTAAIPSIGLIRKHEVRKLAKEMCLDLTSQRMHAMRGNRLNYFLALHKDSESVHYYSYKLNPATDTVSSQIRGENKDNLRKIHITMKAIYIADVKGLEDLENLSIEELEAAAREEIEVVRFDNYGYLLSMDEEIYKLVIKIDYDSVESKIVFNGVTGHYSIN